MVEMVWVWQGVVDSFKALVYVQEKREVIRVQVRECVKGAKRSYSCESDSRCKRSEGER